MRICSCRAGLPSVSVMGSMHEIGRWEGAVDENTPANPLSNYGVAKNALRQRPDRIVVGEVRGGEAIDMLQAMNTGHDGSLTTLHAGTAEEAILRLVLMARFGMDLPAQIIEEQVATALDLVVMSMRRSDGSRRITSLSQVRRAKEGGVELVPLVSYDTGADSWQLCGEPAFVGRAVEERRLAREEVEQWRSSISPSARAA